MPRIPILIAAFAITTAPATATTYCATSAAEIQAHLNSAEVNGQHDEVRIQSGNYNAPAGGFRFENRFADNFDLTISGGWSPFFNNPCGIRFGSNAFDTELRGNNTTRVMEIFPNTNTDVRIEMLTFANGNTVGLANPDQGGAGLNLISYVGYLGSVVIERNVFRSNSAGDFGGGFKGGAGNRFELVNNLFLTNSAECRHGAASITNNVPTKVNIVSNTVAYNGVGTDCSADATGGMRLGGDSEALVINNIFWGNENVDLRLNTLNARLVANNYAVLLGLPAPGSGVDFNLDPQFDGGGFFPVRLGDQSPLINRGVSPSSSASWFISADDLDGFERVQSERIDLGAFENRDRLLMDGFE